jgi:hypothetical protein
VFSGAGFSSNIKSFLIASGRAVELEELESWVQLFFGLELPPAPERRSRSARPAPAG